MDFVDLYGRPHPVVRPVPEGYDLPRLMEALTFVLYDSDLWHVGAPALGINLQAFVCLDGKKNLLEAANPVIEAKDVMGNFVPVPAGAKCPEELMPGNTVETCPSLQGKLRGQEGSLVVGVTRPRVIRMTAIDRTGAQFTRMLHAEHAVWTMHWVDHFNGITLLDRIGRQKRLIVTKAMRDGAR